MAVVRDLYSDLNKRYSDMLDLSFQQTELLRIVSSKMDTLNDEDAVIQNEMQKLELLTESRGQLALSIEEVQNQIAELESGNVSDLRDAYRVQIVTTVEGIIANDELNQRLGSSLQDITQSKIGTIRRNVKALDAYNHTVIIPWFIDRMK